MNSKPAVYRKKPVEVVAVQLTAENGHEVAKWCGCDYFEIDREPHIRITTLEGVMYAKLGWWIIQGVEGEFYPCKDSVFQGTYTLGEPPIATDMPSWYAN